MIAIQTLVDAEILFKLAYGLSLHVHGRGQSLPYLTAFTYGKHGAGGGELALTGKEEKIGSSILEHVATMICANQMDSVLYETIPNRFEDADPKVRSAAIVIRLIRNAFAHNPFAPTWKKERNLGDGPFIVDGILELEIAKLHGKQVRTMHYGGPLAMLRLLQFVRRVIKARLKRTRTKAAQAQPQEA